MKKCKCGASASRNASFCPNCGHRFTRPAVKFLGWFFGIVILGAFLMSIFFPQSQSSSSALAGASSTVETKGTVSSNRVPELSGIRIGEARSKVPHKVKADVLFDDSGHVKSVMVVFNTFSQAMDAAKDKFGPPDSCNYDGNITSGFAGGDADLPEAASVGQYCDWNFGHDVWLQSDEFTTSDTTGVFSEGRVTLLRAKTAKQPSL